MLNKSSFLLVPMFLIPFTQLGVTFYIATHFFCFVVLFVVMIFSVRNKILLSYLLLGFILFMFKYLVIGGLFSHDAFVTLREYICWVLIILASQTSISSQHFITVARKFIVVFLYLSMVLVVVQYMSIQRGDYFGFPLDWFVVNYGTLSGIEKSLEFGTRTRPTGFFGEPSYMGFVVIVLYSVHVFIKSYKRKFSPLDPLAIACFITLFFLQSSTAIVSFIIMFITLNYHKINPHLLLGILLLVFFVLIMAPNDFVNRFETIASGGGDLSGYIRYIAPLLILNDVVSSMNVFGVSVESIKFYSEGYGISGIDNAVIYLFLHYGILALPILLSVFFIISKKVSIKLGLLMLLVMNFNGGFFTYDKAFILFLVILLVTSNKKCILRREANIQSGSKIFQCEKIKLGEKKYE